MLLTLTTLTSLRHQSNQLSMIFAKQIETDELLTHKQKSPDGYFNKIFDEKNSFVILGLVMTKTQNGNLHQLNPWFGQYCIGSISCLDTLAPNACVLCCKPNITIPTYGFTLNNLNVTNVNALNPLVLATGYSQFGTLLVLLGRKLQLISWAHGLHHILMVMWNSLFSHALTPQPTLFSLQGYLKI